MSKHTDGPWHLGGNGFIVYAQNGYAICDVKTFHGRNDADAGNARLIAAAPDLLEALIDLADWLAYGLNKAAGAEPTAEDHAACARVAAKARAAVNKATGAA